MAIKLDEVNDEALGSISKERFVDAAIADAKAIGASDPDHERWVQPLVRAIRRKRLQLPSLSATTQRVVQLIEEPEVNLDDLADAVSGDPVLAMRLIGVANSSYFRGATEVPNVRDALMRMGIREARTIIIVVALKSTLLRSQGLGDSAQALWRHSLLSAAATQEITQELPPWEQVGFMAGLLHDIGQLVVLSFAGELPAWTEDGAELAPATIELALEATHASLGAMLLGSWGFPDSLCEAVLAHHDPETVEAENITLARAVALGDAVAHQLEAGWPAENADLDPLIQTLSEFLGLSEACIADLAQEAEVSFEALSKVG
jgi:HD-like signal output (HDOD) protein